MDIVIVSKKKLTTKLLFFPGVGYIFICGENIMIHDTLLNERNEKKFN